MAVILLLVGVLHGRAGELALVAETLASAREGRGRVVCFTGEAGIGKSSLLAAAREQASGFVVCAGAAWESGGAPPYWPWLSVLRDAEARFGARVRELPGASELASLVPEWGAGAGQPALEPSAARFALLDGFIRVLVALAREQPLLVMLDDLHATDVPTLDLFQLLVRELPRASIAVIAAWREGELATRPDAAQRLARAARHAVVQPLRRLTADEVAGWVGEGAAAVHASTEGNPLFVEETLRARRAGTPPRAIAHVIEDHLALLSAATRELLADASVLGRELDAPLVRAVTARDDDAIAAAMREAEGVGVVERRERGWAFRHVLLRDHLFDALAPSQRAALHQLAGEALGKGTAAAAHHLLRGTDPATAIAAARAAAASATAVFAFEDAVVLLEAALRETRGDALELRIELAEARFRAGQVELGRAECVRAAELARGAHPELIPRIALVYGSELTSGRRDPQMIALLEEGLAGLPPGDSPLRSRVMARLAAACIPYPANEYEPIALALEAVAMARRIGDPETLFYSLRYLGHAQGFRTRAREHIAIAREVIDLSDRLGRPLESLEQRTWLVCAQLALADRAGSDVSLATLEELLARAPQPHYQWRAPLLRSHRAVLRGDFIEAQRHVAIAREIAREHELPRARIAWPWTALSIAHASGDAQLAASIVDDLEPRARSMGNIAEALLSLALALAGRRDEALRAVKDAAGPAANVLAQIGAEAVLLLGIRDRYQPMLDALLPALDLYPMVQGIAGSLMLRPVAFAIGELELGLGKRDAAIAHIEQGLALARAIHGVPYIANGEALLAQARGPAPISAPRAESLAITCGADLARVHWRGREVVAPAGKGFDYLAALVATPGREIHVSDLVGDDDRGDAGEVLDARARGEYRERAREVELELAEARDRNDLGRVERLTAELEVIAEQLVGATGLGGRARRAGSRVERARVNVQRRIKDAIRKLASEDEALGRYLEATIRTGVFCAYVPV